MRQTIVDVAHNETNMPALQSPAQLAATERITVNASQTPLMTLDEETYMVPLTLPQGQRLVPVAWTIQQLDGTQSEQSLPRLFIKHHDGTSFLELTVSSDHSQQEFGLDGSRNLAATIHSAPGTIAPSLVAAQLDGHFASQTSQKQIWNQGSEALSQRSAIAFLPSLKESVERAHALSPIRHSIPSQSSNQAGTLPNSPLFHHEDASHLGSKPSSQISTRQSFNLSAQYASNGTMHPRSSDRGHDRQNLTSEQLHGIQRLTTVDDVFHTSYLPTKSSEFEPETVKQSIGTYSPVAASRISFDNFDQVRSGLFPDHDLSIESLFPELNGRFFPQTAQEAWCGDAQISRSSHETVDQNLHQVPANTKSASRGKLRKDSSRSLTKDSSKIRLLASPNTGGVSQQRRRLFDQVTFHVIQHYA